MNGRITIGDAISRGIKVLGENWPLVPVQFGFFVIQILLFVVVLILPVAVALVAAGVDADMFDDPDALADRLGDDPLGFLRENVFVLALFLFCLAVYLTLALVVALFGAGGSAGVLGRAVRTPGENFSFGLFFSEAKRLFMPLMWFYAALSAVALGILILFALAAVAVLVILGMGGEGMEGNPVLAIFAVMGVLFLIFLLIIIAFVSGLFAKFGSAAIVFDAAGPIEAFGRTYAYMKANMAAIGLYTLCVLVLFAVSFGMGIVNAILELIPVVGGALSLLFQIGVAAVNIFVSLAITAICFEYFFRTSRPSADAEPPGGRP